MPNAVPDCYNPFLHQVDLREPDPYNIAIVGWEADRCSVIVSERGTFYARFGEIYCRFGIADGASSFKWMNHSGYLPCLVTSFRRGMVDVEICHFCNKVTIAGQDYSLLYSRVRKTNRGSDPLVLPANPSADLVRLSPPPATIRPGETEVEDFVTAVDQFGGSAPWPPAEEMIAQGSWDRNFDRMRRYWDDRLSRIVQFEKLPDPRLADAFRAGHIYQLIMLDGNELHVGVNAYRQEFSHDTIGMLVTLIQCGDLELSRRLLDAHRAPLVAPMDYPDGNYKYPWPWTIYLLKTGDVDFVKSNFTVIKSIMHSSANQATGPGGIMRKSYALDHPGYWLVDNWSMLTGLAAYRVLCERLGEDCEAAWALKEYDRLMKACNRRLEQVSKREGIRYLPAHMLHGQKDCPTKDSRSAGWATTLHFGRWPWECYMLGARQDGIMLDLIDATYDWGFDQSRNALPPHTFGGWPGWCTSYNAGFAFAALRGDRYRSEGIRAYQFMIERAMNGPFSWWEGATEPKAGCLWEGEHPAKGSGSCPHMWGDSFSRKILLNSLIDEFADGRVIIGRGVPEEWLAPGREIRVTNFPLQDNRRFGYHLIAEHDSVQINFIGDSPAGEIVLDLPGFEAGYLPNSSKSVVLRPVKNASKNNSTL